jgi:peptidoglycan/xylan/chitin deacetylase (PgdA/CDA1 family)
MCRPTFEQSTTKPCPWKRFRFPEGKTSALVYLFAALMLAGPWFLRVGRSEEHAKSPVYVILWLDTEDYISPPSDDSAKRLAEFLTQQGIRATFKVVGEKARTLERRGRQDVIRALTRHEIGYHSNFHSRHPIVEEYEEPIDWNDGVREFTRRERSGFDDVARIFGRPPSCYGQPGAAWAPQAFAALKQWGVRVYLDDGDHVGLDGKPFWYGGLLNIFNLPETNRLRPDPDWTNLNQVKANFQQFYSRLSSEEKGGIISIYYHPWEFIIVSLGIFPTLPTAPIPPLLHGNPRRCEARKSLKAPSNTSKISLSTSSRIRVWNL